MLGFRTSTYGFLRNTIQPIIGSDQLTKIDNDLKWLIIPVNIFIFQEKPSLLSLKAQTERKDLEIVILEAWKAGRYSVQRTSEIPCVIGDEGLVYLGRKEGISEKRDPIMGNYYLIDTKFQFGVINKFQGWMVVMVEQQYECT